MLDGEARYDQPAVETDGCDSLAFDRDVVLGAPGSTRPASHRVRVVRYRRCENGDVQLQPAKEKHLIVLVRPF